MRLAILTLILVGCQNQPTKINESHEREYLKITEKAEKPIVVDDDTVVLDTRSSFDFGLNHVRNSQSFPWTTLAEDPRKGDLLRDSRQAALGLALHGVGPQTPVVVVGYGLVGKGEEGRLAWTLLALGFHDVQVHSVEGFRRIMTQDPSPIAKNIALYSITPVTGLTADLAELKTPSPQTILIDVREAKEFSETRARHPELKLQNIEWKRFYNAQGRPDLYFVSELKKLGVTPDKDIIVISNQGVRSGAAAYALLAMGYPRVRNAIKGWSSWP